MTRAELMIFRDALVRKQLDLAVNSPGRECIAIERSADEFDDAQYETAREIAIVVVNRESSIRRSVSEALLRIEDGSFGICQQCDGEISRRRLTAVPWARLCVVCQEAADLEQESVVRRLDPLMVDAA